MGRGNFLPIIAAAFLIIVVAIFIVFKPRLGGIIPPSPSLTPIITPTSFSWNPCDVLAKGSLEFDFPPLYEKDITWENAVISEYEVPMIPNPKIIKGCLIKSKQTGIYIASDAENYYIRESQEQKWEIEDAGDGPGFGYITWKIANSFFLFKIDEVQGNLNMKTVTLFLSE